MDNKIVKYVIDKEVYVTVGDLKDAKLTFITDINHSGEPEMEEIPFTESGGLNVVKQKKYNSSVTVVYSEGDEVQEALMKAEEDQDIIEVQIFMGKKEKGALSEKFYARVASFNFEDFAGDDVLTATITFAIDGKVKRVFPGSIGE